MTTVNILLADDDSDDQYFFKEALGEILVISHKLTTVYTGRQVLEYLDSGKIPDIIVLDLNMPLLDGYEVLKKLRSSGRYSKIPAFVLTTSDKNSDTIRCKELGCVEFYTKPLSVGGFRNIITDMLTKTQLGK